MKVTGISTSVLETTSGRACITGLSAELRPSRVYVRPKDHGAGRLSTTNVNRTRSDGRWLSLSGRRYGNRLANKSLATYVTFHFYLHSSEPRCRCVYMTIIGKTTQATKCERNLTSPTQNGKLSATNGKVIEQ